MDLNDDRIVILASEDLEHGALDTLTAFVVLSVNFWCLIASFSIHFHCIEKHKYSFVFEDKSHMGLEQHQGE